MAKNLHTSTLKSWAKLVEYLLYNILLEDTGQWDCNLLVLITYYIFHPVSGQSLPADHDLDAACPAAGSGLGRGGGDWPGDLSGSESHRWIT
jgi:hypothetical protein